MTIGERIKKVRENAGISQTELANAIGVSKQSLYKYENNIVTNIPSDNIEAIARITKASPAYIMGWEEQMSEQQSVPDFPLTNHEKEVIVAYRQQPSLQIAVDRTLGITPLEDKKEKRA